MPTDRLLRHPRAALVAFCLLCWLPGFFTIPATDRDEARFVQATKQMLETGDFVTIRNGAEARNRKPVGIHWLQAPFAAAARAAGLATNNPVWPYRVPSLLGALVAVLATHSIGRRLVGEPAALLGAAMLAGSALLVVEAHIAKTDAVLLAATTLAMGVLGRAYIAGQFGAARPSPRPSPQGRGSSLPPLPLGEGRGEGPGHTTVAVFWLALGVGVLVKGPITPLVVGLAALALAVADRRARWLGALRPAWGVPLALAVVLPWFVAIELATDGAFLRDAAGGDLGRKLAGGAEAHGAPPGTHLVLLAATLFPTGFLLLRAVPEVWRGRREAATRFLLAWAVPAWLVFELTPTKLPHYTLPLLPPLCLLAARAALAPGQTLPRWLGAVAMVVFGLGVAVFAGGAAALPLVVQGPAWLGLPALLAAGVLAFTVFRSRRDPARAAWTALAAVPLLWWAILAVELPALRPLWVSRDVAALAAGRPLAAVGYAEPSLMFAAGTGTLWLDAPAAARWLMSSPGRVVAVESRRVAEFRAAEPAAAAFARVAGVNYSNGRRVEVTLYTLP